MSVQPNAEQGAQHEQLELLDPQLRLAWFGKVAQALAETLAEVVAGRNKLETTVTQQASENQALRQEIEALHTSVFDAGIEHGRALAQQEIAQQAETIRGLREERAHANAVIRTAREWRRLNGNDWIDIPHSDNCDVYEPDGRGSNPCSCGAADLWNASLAYDDQAQQQDRQEVPS